jgi:hypothetical protein
MLPRRYQSSSEQQDMLKKYKNWFFDALCGQGYDPIQFRADETRVITEEYWTIFGKKIIERPAFLIRFQKTPMRFVVVEQENDFEEFRYYYTMFKPKFPETVKSDVVEILSVQSAFFTWLRDHIAHFTKEITSRDLWSQIEAQRPFINTYFVSDEDTTAFSQQEKSKFASPFKFSNNLLKKISILIHNNSKRLIKDWNI